MQVVDNQADELTWSAFSESLTSIGAAAAEDFAFDNERPRHQFFVPAFQLAHRTITNGEYLQFMEDNGYGNKLLWLSDGWDWRRRENVEQPLYWIQRDGDWYQFTLTGLRPLHLQEPVCHLNYFEADAYSNWAQARLPTEQEWEYAAAQVEDSDAAFLESGTLHPETMQSAGKLSALRGNCWEWTSSAYRPYPGYKPFAGEAGEYNSKFMNNQYVLKGGSCVTPRTHIRDTYRNFFYPHQRWQFCGLRLAKDA